MFMLEEASRLLTGKVIGREHTELDNSSMGDIESNEDEVLTFHQASCLMILKLIFSERGQISVLHCCTAPLCKN